MIKKFKIYENSIDIIEQIKKFLIEDNEYESWKEFIDNQQMGDCQGICYSIERQFPQAKRIFGELTLDEPCIDWDNDGQEEFEITHHWVMIDNTIYDFSKGTFKDYIKMDDYELYEPEVIDNWRYKDIGLRWIKENYHTVDEFKVGDIVKNRMSGEIGIINYIKPIVPGIPYLWPITITYNNRFMAHANPSDLLKLKLNQHFTKDDPYGEENWGDMEFEGWRNIFKKKREIVQNPHSELDPYGEENWNDSLEIERLKTRFFKYYNIGQSRIYFMVKPDKFLLVALDMQYPDNSREYILTSSFENGFVNKSNFKYVKLTNPTALNETEIEKLMNKLQDINLYVKHENGPYTGNDISNLDLLIKKFYI